MIDLRQLRADPDRFIQGAREKGIAVDIPRLLEIDERRRAIMAEQEARRAEQKKLSRETGAQLGQLRGALKSLEGEERSKLEAQIRELEARPIALKAAVHELEQKLVQIDPEWQELLLQVPQPPDDDVPKGASAADNVELRRWSPSWFDMGRSFAANKGFQPRTHIELVRELGLVDFERGVKMAGTRQYVLTGEGMRLHQAVLRYAFDFITNECGFTPMSVPVIVREECMVGTGFFPAGRDQAYHIEESKRGAGQDLFLTGTGEVGLMGLHQDEILDGASLPLKYATVSTCFRREAGAAGKDTAGLYRVHQFDKVEQVVICRADEAESRAWHKRMIEIVEHVLQGLELPYRLLQCCTADLGPKNADMIDIECWMPGRGEADADGRPRGEYGETHSASRLYDYQCRRLNMRYRDASAGGGQTVFCHSLNNTVIAGPRVLIPILEMYQNEDGSVTIPEVLRPHMQGRERIEPAQAPAAPDHVATQR
jgi:seryl-tRNA synthetase